MQTLVAVSKYCGDHAVSAGEQCDDGNVVSGDGCSATCQVEFLPHCGDGRLGTGEECDDGDLRDGDGCTRLCRLESGSCGNGRLETALGEQCDDGNDTGSDGCTACEIDPGTMCGDGVVQEDEMCDTGDRNSTKPSACRPNCLLPRCGDGVLDFNEECDDGNNLNVDSCSAVCELEQPAAPYVANVIQGKGQDDINNPNLTPEERLEIIRQRSRVLAPEQTKTGPGLVIFLASGAAAGIGIARRRTRV